MITCFTPEWVWPARLWLCDAMCGCEAESDRSMCPPYFLCLALASDLPTHSQCMTSESSALTCPLSLFLSLTASCCSCVILHSFKRIGFGPNRNLYLHSNCAQGKLELMWQRHIHCEDCGFRYSAGGWSGSQPGKNRDILAGIGRLKKCHL